MFLIITVPEPHQLLSTVGFMNPSGLKFRRKLLFEAIVGFGLGSEKLYHQIGALVGLY